MKIVKNKDFQKDESFNRHDNPDSPLRYPMNVHMAESHERRIHWLYYENYQICKDYISAQLLYSIAKLKYKERGENKLNLKEYKAIKNAFSLWYEVNSCAKEYGDKETEALSKAYKYHYVGDAEETLEELLEED